MPEDQSVSERVNVGIDFKNPKALSVLNHIDEIRAQFREKVDQKEPAVELTNSERAILEEVQIAARCFFTNKAHSLQLSESQESHILERIKKIPYARFIKPLSKAKHAHTETHGSWDGDLNILSIIKDDTISDLLNLGKIIGHEMSHASVYNEVRRYFEDEKTAADGEYGLPVPIGKVERDGLDTVTESNKGNKHVIRKAGALENGLAELDAIDFYYSILRQYFPQEFKKRANWKKDKDFQKRYAELCKTSFGALPLERIDPLMYIQKKRLPLVGVVEFSPTADPNLNNQVRFTEEVCKIVGYSLTSEAERNTATSEDFFRKGRLALDRDRFSGTFDGTMKLIEIFGGKQIIPIFHADDLGNHLNEAMEVVNRKKQELGIS